ncbi:hypothetical protein L486_00598 [Kwoniella mangroviensis CBS 10435]|uniref:Uncharacterized protein n=1 Tax=Kwoniella mangroviensis CBS 10435 TaxID=1331196 RepID=A0A1B9IZW3_9TREE|nr:hypothetical protein L486_00598 [Kwoniella mangroviensis CBS 10435]
MSGIIPLSPSPGSSKAERSITESVEKRECDRCSENIPIDKFKQRYEELMSVVDEIWESEQKGVLLPNNEEATNDEIRILSTMIPEFLRTFPNLIYPIPYLQIRYARLLSTLARTLSNTKEIIKNYTQAYSSFLSLNNNLSTPLTYSLAFELVNSHWDILRISKQLIEKRSNRKIGYENLGKSNRLKTSKQEYLDDGEIESYLKEGQDWIESCKDHLNDLAFTQHNHGYGSETKFNELELERWQRQFEELDIWFNYLY